MLEEEKRECCCLLLLDASARPLGTQWTLFQEPKQWQGSHDEVLALKDITTYRENHYLYKNDMVICWVLLQDKQKRRSSFFLGWGVVREAAQQRWYCSWLAFANWHRVYQKLKVGGDSQCKGGDVVKVMANSKTVKKAAWLAQKVICAESKDIR